MSVKRGTTDLSGVLLVDKPTGMTSHDVVARIRRSCGERRVGHAGTLDPLATGLLVVLVGPATRLEPYLAAQDKTYVTRIAFGAATDTDDADGTVVRTAPVPDALRDAATARALLACLLGRQSQIPPAYSAIKLGGRPAYRSARAGQPIVLPPRDVTVLEADLLALDDEAATWDVRFRVSKGTYVRALARDLGERAGSAAHLTALRRTASGPLDLSAAHTLDEVEAAGTAVEPLFTDPVRALGLAHADADPTAVLAGRALPCPVGIDLAEDGLLAVTSASHLLALYRRAGDLCVPQTVLSRPAAGVRA